MVFLSKVKSVGRKVAGKVAGSKVGGLIKGHPFAAAGASGVVGLGAGLAAGSLLSKVGRSKKATKGGAHHDEEKEALLRQVQQLQERNRELMAALTGAAGGNAEGGLPIAA